MFNGTTSTKFVAPRPVCVRTRAGRRQERKEKYLPISPKRRALWFDCAHHPESIEGRLCAGHRFSDYGIQISNILGWSYIGVFMNQRNEERR